MHEGKPSWKKRALDELRKLSITVAYMWLLLSVFTFHREIILANYHINYSAKFGFAFINAVILAKFMWLGEFLLAGKKAAGKALLYSMLWNSAVFTVNPNGLPRSGGSINQRLARSVFCRELF